MQQEELLAAFQRNLRLRRKELGLTQVQLAERAGVEQGYISDLEMGKKKPMLGTLAPLAEALDTTPSALISTVGMMELAR